MYILQVLIETIKIHDPHIQEDCLEYQEIASWFFNYTNNSNSDFPEKLCDNVYNLWKKEIVQVTFNN